MCSKSKKKSFSLLELIIVIVILGILSGIVLYSTRSAVDASLEIAIKQDLISFAKIMETRAFEESRKNGNIGISYEQKVVVDGAPQKKSFCQCLNQTAGVFCLPSNIPEVKRIVSKYHVSNTEEVEGVRFFCGSPRMGGYRPQATRVDSQWGAFVWVKNKTALGDFNDNAIVAKVFCVSSTTAFPVVIDVRSNPFVEGRRGPEGVLLFRAGSDTKEGFTEPKIGGLRYC